MKTKIEIINETANAYTSKTLALQMSKYSSGEDIGPVCKYYTKDGKMCAVGRCMKDPKGFQESFDPDDDTNIYGYCIKSDKKDIDHLLKEEYHGHSLNFWSDIQIFHDMSGFWNEDGLSEKGKVEYNKLVELYKGR